MYDPTAKVTTTTLAFKLIGVFFQNIRRKYFSLENALGYVVAKAVLASRYIQMYINFSNKIEHPGVCTLNELGSLTKVHTYTIFLLNSFCTGTHLLRLISGFSKQPYGFRISFRGAQQFCFKKPQQNKNILKHKHFILDSQCRVLYVGRLSTNKTPNNHQSGNWDSNSGAYVQAFKTKTLKYFTSTFRRLNFTFIISGYFEGMSKTFFKVERGRSRKWSIWSIELQGWDMITKIPSKC
jgi:hypothetical protein